jgi:hypothetical protein
MKPFKIHTAQDTLEPAASILRGTEKTLGFVPNLFGVLAESPSALAAFTALNAQFATDPRTAISKGTPGNTETDDSVVDGLLSARLQTVRIERSRAGVDPSQLCILKASRVRYQRLCEASHSSVLLS